MREIKKPKVRADCINVPRPCPFVSCKYNTFLEVKPDGKLKIIQDCESPLDMEVDNCALDIVDKFGALTLDEIGDMMNVTRERVRQIADAACRKMKLF